MIWVRRFFTICIAMSLSMAIAGTAWAKPRKPRVVVFTNAQVSSALLALADMPAGYAATPPQGTQPSGTNGTCNGPNETARAQTAGAVASGFAQFAQNPTTGPLIAESIYSFPTVHAAQSFMSATRTLAASCTTYSSGSGGSPTTFTVNQLSFARVADDTFAVRRAAMQSGSAGSSGTVDNIAIRVGNNTITLAEGALTGPDLNLERQYVGKAVAKLGVATVSTKPSSKKK